MNTLGPRIYGSEVVAHALKQDRTVVLTPADRHGFHLEIDGRPLTDGSDGLPVECFDFPILEKGRRNTGIAEDAVGLSEDILFSTDPPHCSDCYGYQTRRTVTKENGEDVTVLHCRRCERTRPEGDGDE